MYWNELRRGFREVDEAREKGLEELERLKEHYREKLCDVLDEEGIVILEQYTACLDLLNKQDRDDIKIFEESLWRR